MLPDPLRYGIETAIGLAGMCAFLLGARYADRAPSLRLYRGVPLSLAWMCGAGALYTLLQALFPSLDTSWHDTLVNFVPLGVGTLSAIFSLCRTRYVQDTVALLALLFMQFVLFLVNLAGTLPHPTSPPSFLAFYAAWCAVGSASLLPCIWFDRWLRERLGPRLPLPAFIQSARKHRPFSHRVRFALMLSACGAVISLAILAYLAAHRHLDTFVAALPPTTAVVFGLYGLGTALHWVLRALFLGKPIYGSLSRPGTPSDIIVTVQPSDERQAEQGGEE